MRKDEIGGGKHCDRNHAQRSSHLNDHRFDPGRDLVP
jgi:hypothetical protein